MESIILPVAEELNVAKEARYCINASYQFLAKQKKQKFMNKMNLTYSLRKINKQKLYGKMISTSIHMFPQVAYQNVRYTAHQYSNPSIRDKRRHFLELKMTQPQQHKESIRRYSQFLSKKKQKQGGLDSFWLFKKDKKEAKNQQKKGHKEQQLKHQQQVHLNNKDRVSLAFQKILAWGKLPIDINNSLVSKNLLKNYLASIISESFSAWFINFFQIRSYINFNEFQILGQKFKNVNLRYSHLLSFFLYDCNGDGYICPRDAFTIFSKDLDPRIEADILKIAHFTKNNIREQQPNNKFKPQQLIIQDDSLTFKDYEPYFKKIQEPFLLATNKKDTGFSKTFAVMDHRQKVRSTRRQFNQKRIMYDQMYGKLDKHKHSAYVQPENYKLNYSLFYEIFQQRSTNIFNVFCEKVFGIVSKLN